MLTRKSLIAFAVSLSFTVLVLCNNIRYIQADDNPKAGESLELTIKNVKYRFRYCPAGTFTMGSPVSERSRGNDEQLHPVTLSQGFYLAETEVTQEQWGPIMGNNPSRFRGAKLPVEQVSWDVCREFVRKLNALDAAPKGYKFALPTESQWEYACRAGSTTAYCFGDDSDRLGDYAWHPNNSSGRTHEVGTKKPNAWNLYDMHGNVWELCADWYGNYVSEDYVSERASAPAIAPIVTPVIDPKGASSGSIRVRRGGGWYDVSAHCRSALRDYYAPDCTNRSIGVRVALVRGE
ncbi:MAG: formylglycine-generating enzyme family protein [Planctomycetaceae bacterium]|nr:formylglycine-generating enzyme family protein [Planctomycetaceae bacterium]